MALPTYQGGDQSFQLMQSTWAAQLNPMLANTILQGRQISNVTLGSGSPATINHLLGRQMLGWILTDVTAPTKIARIQPLNSQTLTLSADTACTVSVWVY